MKLIVDGVHPRNAKAVRIIRSLGHRFGEPIRKVRLGVDPAGVKLPTDLALPNKVSTEIDVFGA